jgi:hypothetical protein
VNKHLLNLLFVAALAAGCESKAPNGGVPERPIPLENKSFSRIWATDLRQGKEDAINAVHVTDQFIFAYRKGGTSSVLDRATGRLLHIDEPKESIQRLHPPVVLKNRIVYPTTTFLEVYDFEGRYIPRATKVTDELDKPFSQELPFPIHSDAVGSGNLLFFGADFPGSGRAVEVDMTRPYVPALWTLMEPGSSISAAPALVKDVIFVASDNGKVAAVATDTRDPIWTLDKGVFGTYGGVFANLVADATGVYIASTDTKLYCLTRTGGKVKWQFFANVPLREPPVLSKDLVFELVPGTGMVAIDKTELATSKNPTYNRAPRWIAPNAAQFVSEDDTYVYLRSFDNDVMALDKKTGEQKFSSRRTDLAVFGVNTKGDGIIYVATSEGRVMAVKPVLTAGQVGEIVLVPVAMPEQAMAAAR